MAETYPTPRFGAPREPKSPVNPGSGLVRMLDIVTASHARAVGFLVLCALLLFLPGFFTRRAAVLAALMMCASVLLGVEARLAKTDAVLLLCVVAAMGAMERAYLSWQRAEDETHPPWSWPAIFWTAMPPGCGSCARSGA